MPLEYTKGVDYEINSIMGWAHEARWSDDVAVLFSHGRNGQLSLRGDGPHIYPSNVETILFKQQLIATQRPVNIWGACYSVGASRSGRNWPKHMSIVTPGTVHVGFRREVSFAPIVLNAPVDAGAPTIMRGLDRWLDSERLVGVQVNGYVSIYENGQEILQHAATTPSRGLTLPDGRRILPNMVFFSGEKFLEGYASELKMPDGGNAVVLWDHAGTLNHRADDVLLPISEPRQIGPVRAGVGSGVRGLGRGTRAVLSGAKAPLKAVTYAKAIETTVALSATYTLAETIVDVNRDRQALIDELALDPECDANVDRHLQGDRPDLLRRLSNFVMDCAERGPTLLDILAP